MNKQERDILDFKIITIDQDHKEDIQKLIEEINQEDNLKYSLTDQWLDYVIENAGGGIFLGFHGEVLVGLGTAMINSRYKDQGALNVVVSPRYRNKGLGSILYKKAYDFHKKENVKVVEAFVKERLVNGVDFAEKRGFNIGMYSWEMELDLKNLDFSFENIEELNYRKALPKDGLDYRKIIFDAFGDDLGEDSLIESLKDPSIFVYILEEGNKAIGSASVQLRKDLSLAYIYDIAILRDHRGRGLGSHLIEACIRALKEKDIDKASLLVTGENKRALELYRKIGFKEVDIDFIMVKEI